MSDSKALEEDLSRCHFCRVVAIVGPHLISCASVPHRRGDHFPNGPMRPAAKEPYSTHVVLAKCSSGAADKFRRFEFTVIPSRMSPCHSECQRSTSSAVGHVKTIPLAPALTPSQVFSIRRSWKHINTKGLTNVIKGCFQKVSIA
uniref:Uncharacterized protein n=1 Tax=Steinernema glaseri TaxID=37863 RepID=A0A1I7Y0H6_9BILA